MAKTIPGKRNVEFFTIKRTNKTVRVQDCVLLKASVPGKFPWIARVEKIMAICNSYNVNMSWYHILEGSEGKQRKFHGLKELFLQDHYDTKMPIRLKESGFVHTFKNYTNLESVGHDNYYCQFEYKAGSSGFISSGFIPDRVTVYCKCDMPYNPYDSFSSARGERIGFIPHFWG